MSHAYKRKFSTWNVMTAAGQHSSSSSSVIIRLKEITFIGNSNTDLQLVVRVRLYFVFNTGQGLLLCDIAVVSLQKPCLSLELR